MDEKYPKIKVKRAKTGLGLFALEDIKKGQCIIEYTGERITEDEADRRGGDYLFSVTPTLAIDGKGHKNTARYINHACKPNAEAIHEEKEDRIFIYASKKIYVGEEITYHYGKEFFRDIISKKPRGCQCTSCIKK
jgi:uncharacterized protein